ncbi:alanine dehydrogenase [Flavicella sp.]|uniref:alanine dehydrogenase n=1 Tax=Flavicella sp. TaxID=2957742 RepID=UPI003019370C
MNKQFSPFSIEELIPQEEKLEIQKTKGELFIGLPKETYFEEKRICLTPDAVAAMIQAGHRVVVETGAGKGANYTDQNYSESGAKIAYNPEEVFGCTIILKISPPSLKEIDLIKPQTILVSTLQLKTQSKKYFEALATKRITAIAFDFIRDSEGMYPVVQSLSEIAGTASILIAAELMSTQNKGNGLLLGNIAGVPPAEVAIIGAGTVGEFATKSAIGLGASVKVFDNSISKLRQLQKNIHKPIYTSTLQLRTLQKALMRCDVLIGAIRGKSRAPVVISDEMVQLMKPGAVIVDVSIDRGGCIETSEVTTHSQPTFEKHGVIHYCVPNIPSRYSRTATVSISNILTTFLLDIADEGGFEIAFRNERTLRSGMYYYHGILTKKAVGEWFNLPFNDINLLIL